MNSNTTVPLVDAGSPPDVLQDMAPVHAVLDRYETPVAGTGLLMAVVCGLGVVVMAMAVLG